MTLILHFWLRATSIRCYARLLSPLNRSQVCVCMCVCVLVRFKSEPNVQIFRLGDQIFRIGKLISTFGFLVRTSSFPEIIRNTHPGKDRERDSFVLENVWFTKWFTKAKSFEPDRKIISVRNRIHFLSTLESIVKKHSLLRIRVSEHLPLYLWVHLKANLVGVISHLNRLSTYPTEISWPIQTNIYYIAKLPLGNFKIV